MAKPRVFISSTFYDLSQVRYEIDKFLESIGYEPVRNEEGDIPYGSNENLQKYCYREINNIDILIAVIGSRYGTPSEGDKRYSISNMELKTAIDSGKHVFIFIQKNVSIEYETYLLNKDNENVNYKYVNNPLIYKFIDELKALPKNNNIKDFETADDITNYLKEQFAGMMRQFFIEEEKYKENNLIKDITATASTLKKLVDYLASTSKEKDNKMQWFVNSSHPIIGAIRSCIGIKYKFYIENKLDLKHLLTAYGYVEVNGDSFDYTFENKQREEKIVVSNDIFDENGKLKYFKNEDWKNEWIRKEKLNSDEDLPF